jgi:hypothetical protein
METVAVISLEIKNLLMGVPTRLGHQLEWKQRILSKYRLTSEFQLAWDINLNGNSGCFGGE